MNNRIRRCVLATAALFVLGASSAGIAAAAVNGTHIPKAELYVERRQSVQSVSADADAILRALDKHPDLMAQLVKNPPGGEALLRFMGASRKDHIIVTTDGGKGTLRTIAIRL